MGNLGTFLNYLRSVMLDAPVELVQNAFLSLAEAVARCPSAAFSPLFYGSEIFELADDVPAPIFGAAVLCAAQIDDLYCCRQLIQFLAKRLASGEHLLLFATLHVSFISEPGEDRVPAMMAALCERRDVLSALFGAAAEATRDDAEHIFLLLRACVVSKFELTKAWSWFDCAALDRALAHPGSQQGAMSLLSTLIGQGGTVEGVPREIIDDFAEHHVPDLMALFNDAPFDFKLSNALLVAQLWVHVSEAQYQLLYEALYMTEIDTLPFMVCGWSEEQAKDVLHAAYQRLIDRDARRAAALATAILERSDDAQWTGPLATTISAFVRFTLAIAEDEGA
jgi:hypothetical protein